MIRKAFRLRIVVVALYTSAWIEILFISAKLPTTFPATFFAAPVVSVTMENLTGDGAIWMNESSDVGSFNGRFVRGAALTFTGTMGWMAVGRWK